MIISKFFKNLTRHLALGILLTIVQTAESTPSQISQDSMSRLQISTLSQRSLTRDYGIVSLQQSLDSAYERNDTTSIIRYLIDVSYRYANLAEYNLAYDGYWEALLLAEEINDDNLKGYVYDGLGWLYSLYAKLTKAREYFDLSLSIRKKYVDTQSGETIQALLDTYYALATINRKSNNTIAARQYLDSCLNLVKVVFNDERNTSFIDAEIGYVLLKEGRVSESLNKLLSVQAYFEMMDPTYLVILYPFIAQGYESSGEYEKAENYFQKAIDMANKYQSHLDILPDIYENMSALYVKMNKVHKGYEYLVIAKKLNEQQFGIRSKTNQDLLEIKDSYRLQKEHQDNLIQKQKLETLEQNARISELEKIILYGAIFFLIFLGFMIYRYLRIKYKAEKRFLQHQRAFEQEKANEVLAIKNKELTASALQAIDREELLEEIKTELGVLKGTSEMKDIGRLMKNIDHRTSKSWEEFQLRFMSVHEGFYVKLQKEFPNLSQNDHKLCALIKLNFSSKDMSRLMGISIESVHTTRYRLRKKLGLKRNDNLEDFIASNF